MESLRFEQLPTIISELKNEVLELKKILLQKTEPQQEIDNPLGIKEVAILTGLTVPTLYGYCQRNEIPFNKKGNRLYFFKYEILDWIKTGKQKTISEINTEAELYLKSKKK